MERRKEVLYFAALEAVARMAEHEKDAALAADGSALRKVMKGK